LGILTDGKTIPPFLQFSYLPIGEGANKPANAPTAAEPKAIKPSVWVE
jgi:hypothetical protein